jgi:chromosomal replication initiator protein
MNMIRCNAVSNHKTYSSEKRVVAGIWEEFLLLVKEEAGSRVVETWFKAVSLRSWDSQEHIVYLEAPNQFVRDWIKNNYIPLIQRILQRLLNVESIRVQLVDGTHTQQIKQPMPVHDPEVIQPAVKTSLSYTESNQKSTAIAPHAVYRQWNGINTSYSFDTFIVGPSNSLAYAASQAVAEKPGQMYNPLFIYGESGLGKTHLLHAIGNEISRKDKKAKIVYQTTDRFVNEFIHAIRFDQMHKFQAKYKEIDVLLIDDVQFISNKEQTQEAFFHIFNALYEARKQIIFSSDTYPQNIEGIAERLRSRLAWGLVTDIYAPPLETKVAILKKKAETSTEPLPDDVAHFIASQVFSNIRELEGALVRVMAFASLTRQHVNLELAQKVLVGTGSTAKSRTVGFEHIVQLIQKNYSYSLNELCSKARNKDLSFARQVAMYLMKKSTDKSLRDIGEYLGNRDHSTVMYAVEKVEERCKNNSEFKHKLERMMHDIIHHQ